MEIIFKELMIIDKNSKKAKIQEFKEGINVITSNSDKGNYVGKSTLLKSLYHSLGADLDFDTSKGWEVDSKYYYVLTFEKEKELFTVIRNDHSFSFYDKNRKMIFSSNNRDDLTEFYKSFFNMTILLKKLDKSSNNYQYVASHPFSLFCLSYVGQKHYDGCVFSSFNNMAEYSEIKGDIILSHLGINDSKKNKLEEENKAFLNKWNEKTKSKEIVNKMISKLDENDAFNYSAESIDSIKIQMKLHEEEYRNKISDLHQVKNKLYELNNTRSLILNYINEITYKIEHKENDEKILKKHKCPLCENEISNYNEIFFKKVNVDDSLPLQLTDCQSTLADIDRKIVIKLEKYNEMEEELKRLETILTQNNKTIENAITSLGIKKYKDSLIYELGNYDSEIAELEKQLETNKEIIRELNKKKAEINSSYIDFLITLRQKYQISIFDIPKKLDISSKIKCSDNHVLTIAWMCVLNQLKRKFNPNGTYFPLVFDNPTDRDFDNDNNKIVIKIIFDEKRNSKQIFISKLRFDESQYPDYIIDNKINLINQRYHLLNDEDYSSAIEKLTNLIG